MRSVNECGYHSIGMHVPIDFAPERWERIKETYRKWWAGELDRPVIQAAPGGRDPGRAEPELGGVGKATLYDLSVSPEAIVDRWDYDLSRRRFMGDAFPSVWLDMGPGVLAAFMGGRAEPGSGTIWFHPAEDKKIADVRFGFDPESQWFRRAREVYRAAARRWGGAVQIGMTDLGGNLDVLSTFRPGERLLLDLYDHPDEVKRLTWEEHRAWWRAFEELDAILRPANPGYTAWTPIFSEEPYYVLQCDFCYMIGPRMFDEFVKPELVASCGRLRNAFYHLDGPGQLAHLDSLLEIDELGGVQWVPGEGAKPVTEWPEVYRKIRDAGKLVHLLGGWRELDAVADQLGSAKGLFLSVGGSVKDEEKVARLLERYGVPVE